VVAPLYDSRVKVLVTGAGALLGQGIVRSLINGSLAAEIVAVDPSPLAVGLYWTARRHLVPLARDPSFADRIEALLRLERPDAVLIGTDVELPVFAEHRQDWETRHSTCIVVSAPEAVRIADDKYLTAGFLRARGFAAPESCLKGAEYDLVERIGFPLVVKPRTGARSVGMTVCHDPAQLARAVAEREDVVIQECVGSEHDEYTAGTLVFDGRCEASIVMRRDLRDGNTYRAFVEPFDDLDAQVRLIAEAFGAYGPANFQFRVDRERRVTVFEINARFSGTTPFRMQAGMNEVEMVLRRILRGEPIVQPPLRRLTILRSFTETPIPTEEIIT
jgi:carbamoyl-phosphate synthase large subunit